MKREAFLLCTTLFLLLSFKGTGQNCSILSKANSIVPDKLCSPVEVDWNVTYVGVNNAGTAVEVRYVWDDGSSERVTATEGPSGTFTADANHTYTSQDDKCNYHPEATLVVNGVVCTSSSQEQIVTIWDTDNENGGHVNAEPDVYPVCVGNGATMRFDDGTLFNCVPPQENDVPNEDTRWIQWVYGTNNSMSSSTPVSVDGYTGPWPYEGPVITLPGPVHGSSEQSLPITVADDNLVGEEFEVELRYWNYCNPYPDKPPVTDRSVIRIVGIPDATITPVDTMCEFNDPIVLQVATSGGTFSGNGITNPSSGEFSPQAAQPGTHEIIYKITDANACSSSDSVDITVRDAPAASITPVDPFCIYDPPYDLASAPAQGTWTGNGITDANTGIFDPAVAGLGSHEIRFTTFPDASGCSGNATIEVRVADIPGAQILNRDTAWCERPDNGSTAEIVITGSDTSRFDLVVEIRGTIDTLFNLKADTFTLFLNNRVGINEYILNKVIEHHGSNTCDTDLNDTLVIEVLSLPDITVTASYDDWCSPVDVDFLAGQGYDKYYWNFGDNDSTITRSESITHTYTIPQGDSLYFRVDTLDGVIDTTYYQVFHMDSVFHFQLIAESYFGCRDTIKDSVLIYEAPVADFFVSPEIQKYPQTNVYLINTSSYGNWSYLWNFGDRETDVVKDPNTHRYDEPGFYDIELTTYNDYCRDSITKRVQILPPPPNAFFEPDSVGCPPLEITFSNTSVYADSYLWNFDDGTFSTDVYPTHTFYQSKVHDVKLIAYGMSGTDTTLHSVSIHQLPTALFNAYPLSATNLKQVFKFKNNSINATNYLWDFGDGNTSPAQDATHIYGEEGTFTITLYAWSENDCADTMVQESLITIIAGEGMSEFPNAFVWNGTGPSGGHWTENSVDNTVFHPYMENAIELRLIIYTRWGEKVFESNEVYVGWDGYLESGKLAAAGVYVFNAWITYTDSEQGFYKGDITFLH